MVYGLPEGEGLDSQFDIAFDSGSGHLDSDYIVMTYVLFKKIVA